MSKMSNINLALQEQAEELGFSTVQEAIDNGYVVVYSVEKSKLISPQDQAHEAWLKRKERTLKELRDLQEILETLADGEPHEVSSYWADTIWGTINFIEEGEM